VLLLAGCVRGAWLYGLGCGTGVDMWVCVGWVKECSWRIRLVALDLIDLDILCVHIYIPRGLPSTGACSGVLC
jgi:hypothetical protein